VFFHFRFALFRASLSFLRRRCSHFLLHFFAPHTIYASPNELPHSGFREGDPSTTKWSTVMKLFSRLFATRRESNLTTIRERDRLANTMPGQTGAVQAARLGFLIG